MLYEQWRKVHEQNPGKKVLVFDNSSVGSVVTFEMYGHEPPFQGAFYYPIWGQVNEVTRRLSYAGIPWILVNAPDDVAAACGVPTD